MTVNIQELWATYSNAWREVSSQERGRLLKSSVADDVTFTAPGTSGRGVADLISMLEEFQRTYPGAYFDTTVLIVQNNQLLATWSMLDRTGAVILNGNSYARWGEGERIVHLAGFWQP
ncbi:nuclear transport factor 2 family protein [Acerihabitans sp. TG2]|uniref:nuclear transport factor 2 family protein n=1 Tax=Acerihabitans sp. TG2 TaxID=3096008 RepID=UPI002B22FB75|nr:nuclear transport factor 2 family protein [Acerihabitans sp. TG2]MEA9389798.1 nuclear transport factor 2 family protein [Acerihabitans sp. TG2]